MTFTHTSPLWGISTIQNLVITACDDKLIHIWNVNTGLNVSTFSSIALTGYKITISSANRLFHAGVDGNVREWDLANFMTNLATTTTKNISMSSTFTCMPNKK